MRQDDQETELDHELRAERSMLEHARRCLAAMRRRAESLTSSSGGDWVSEEVLHWHIRQRIASLADDGSSGLFFGRIDYDSGADPPGARFYLGRRHVVDEWGDPVVIDWRARLAHPFYRATPRNRYGVRLRRRFGYQRGALTSFQDEPLYLGEDDGTAERLLAAEIERPRIGPMRDIVATIQPEQDDLIRAPLDETIVVQGGPGTGKAIVVETHTKVEPEITVRPAQRHNERSPVLHRIAHGCFPTPGSARDGGRGGGLLPRDTGHI